MSSASAPFRRRLTAAQNGHDDPLTHYWLKVGKGDYRRLCDDAQWVKGLRYERTPGIECQTCRDMREYDGFFGWAAFSLTYKLRGVFALPPNAVSYVPDDDGLSPRNSKDGDSPMKPVPMTTFADFFVARSDKRKEGIVNRFSDGNGWGGLSYRPLTAMLQRYLACGDIEGLHRAKFNLNPESSDFEKNLAALERARQNCIALWTDQKASYFKVDPAGVPLGRLTVKVSPQIGMTTKAGERAVRLWYQQKPMGVTLSQVYHYLLIEARKKMPWGGLVPGIWDVPRREILGIPALPNDMDSRVSDAAFDFMRIWDSLPPSGQSTPPATPSTEQFGLFEPEPRERGDLEHENRHDGSSAL